MVRLKMIGSPLYKKAFCKKVTPLRSSYEFVFMTVLIKIPIIKIVIAVNEEDSNYVGSE